LDRATEKKKKRSEIGKVATLGRGKGEKGAGKGGGDGVNPEFHRARGTQEAEKESFPHREGPNI